MLLNYCTVVYETNIVLFSIEGIVLFFKTLLSVRQLYQIVSDAIQHAIGNRKALDLFQAHLVSLE